MRSGGVWIAQVYDDLRQYEPNTHPRVRKAWDAERWRDRIIERVRAVAQGIPGLPIEGPVRVDVDFYFPRPGYMVVPKYPAAAIPHDVRPDRDNLDKLVLDAITQAGWREIDGKLEKIPVVFSDDCAVCAGEPRKFYCAVGDAPGARVVVTRLADPEPALFNKGR